MNTEYLTLQELPTEELVKEYLKIPFEIPVEFPELPGEFEIELLAERNKNQEIVNWVQEGKLEPESAQGVISESGTFYIKGHPELRARLQYMYLFDQARVWIGHSILLQARGDYGESFVASQEKVARLLMFAEITAGSRKTRLTRHVLSSLINAGFYEEAKMVGEESFEGVFFTESREEVEEFARMMGEKDPEKAREGIATNQKKALRFDEN